MLFIGNTDTVGNEFTDKLVGDFILFQFYSNLDFFFDRRIVFRCNRDSGCTLADGDHIAFVVNLGNTGIACFVNELFVGCIFINSCFDILFFADIQCKIICSSDFRYGNFDRDGDFFLYRRIVFGYDRNGGRTFTDSSNIAVIVYTHNAFILGSESHFLVGCIVGDDSDGDSFFFVFIEGIFGLINRNIRYGDFDRDGNGIFFGGVIFGINGNGGRTFTDSRDFAVFVNLGNVFVGRFINNIFNGGIFGFHRYMNNGFTVFIENNITAVDFNTFNGFLEIAVQNDILFRHCKLIAVHFRIGSCPTNEHKAVHKGQVFNCDSLSCFVRSAVGRCRGICGNFKFICIGIGNGIQFFP